MEYIFPSDNDRACDNQLNEACEYIEYLQARQDEYHNNLLQLITDHNQAMDKLRDQCRIQQQQLIKRMNQHEPIH